ncbi:uncharacterized protein LOC134836602 [Culicoides brevitarsis]|uniref:uncharacterized protein LOC134836602 n=1 Tax=Culicoides brevitarsis TaxID=469753 RepID=UPI00307C6E11
MNRLINKSLLRHYSSLKNTKFNKFLDIKPEIYDALYSNKKPIVALESTIITHGMPYPDNLRTAVEVEEIVRKQNAIPATIALLDGKIKVGLDKNDLEKLANPSDGKKNVKVSRRDLAFALHNKRNGGTTVAGTLIVCNMVGIKVFATGGIGGVHRNVEKTLDISADLQELARSSGTAVVCSGVKSILDIPRTMEFLETQGVFVGAFGTDEFPAFFTRKSGVKAPYSLKNSLEAANILQTNGELGLNGMLIAVPIPEEFSMDEVYIDGVIREALKAADQQGIQGKEVTPFILQALNEATKGKSLKSNIALIKNNAKVAAEIAVKYHELNSNDIKRANYCSDSSESGRTDKKFENSPVIIGGSNIDTCIKILDDDMKLDGATYSAKSSICCGGVGRNLAEGVGKIYGSSTFISAIGDDQNGSHIKSVLEPVCNTEFSTEKDFPTANATVLFNKDGDCKLVTLDMAVHRCITPELIQKNKNLIKNSPLTVFDANLSIETIEEILKLAREFKKPAFFEPTDLRLSHKPFLRKPELCSQIKFATPNLDELRNMAKFLGFEISQKSSNLENRQEILKEVKFLAEFMSKKIENLIITLGSLGVVVARHGSSDSPFFENHQYLDKKSELTLRYYPSEEISNVVNVSGAGDSFSSGFIAGMIEGLPENVCVSIGFEAAKKALLSKNAVAGSYFDRNHKCWSTSATYENL